MQSDRGRWLILLLRTIGLIDAAALIAVLAPRSWIAANHEWLGLGSFPEQPIAGYLARCTSIWYVSYGLLLWFVSFDTRKYAQLITLLACTMLIQGLVIIGIDVSEGMPLWWCLLEGPCCSVLGGLLMIVQRYAATEAGATL